MIGLTNEIVKEFAKPIIKILKGGKGKDLKRELYVKCYTIWMTDRDSLLKKLRQYGEVNIVDWDNISLYEIKGVDPLDLEKLIRILKETFTKN
jgi:hypothetical protein